MNNILLFDYDGVIVDSFPLVFDTVQKLGPKYNLPKFENKEDLQKLFETNIYDALLNLGLDKNKINHFKERLGLKLIMMQLHLELFPNIKDVLEKLSQNNILIMITSNFSTVVKRYLKKKKINVFQDILGAEVDHSKIIKINMIKDKYPNSDIYYIGDTSGDIKEGKKAKVKTVAVTWGYHNKKLLKKENPNYLLNKPEELLKLFT